VHSSSVVARRLSQPCFLHMFCFVKRLVSFCVSPENNKEKRVLLIFLLLSGVDNRFDICIQTTAMMVI